MGDIADWIIDQMMDGNYHSDYYDEDFHSKLTHCKYCLEGDLVWGEHESGWRLFTLDGQLHFCRKYKKSK